MPVAARSAFTSRAAVPMRHFEALLHDLIIYRHLIDFRASGFTIIIMAAAALPMSRCAAAGAQPPGRLPPREFATISLTLERIFSV